MTASPGEHVATEVGIVSADARALVPFYEAVFGMSVTSELSFSQGTVHRLERGEARLKIFQPSDPVELRTPPEPWHQDTGMAYAAFHSADVDDAYEAATANGGTGLVEPTTHRPGARFALIRDPQGNTWELLSESD